MTTKNQALVFFFFLVSLFVAMSEFQLNRHLTLIVDLLDHLYLKSMTGVIKADILGIEYSLEHAGRPFIYNKNRRGPKIDPRGIL